MIPGQQTRGLQRLKGLPGLEGLLEVRMGVLARTMVSRWKTPAKRENVRLVI